VPVPTSSRPWSAIIDELRMLDKVGGMADDTWHQHVARRQLRLLPHAPLMLVPHVARLEGIGLRLHLEDQVDDGSSGRSRVCMPAAPAQVVTRLLLGNADKRVVDGIDAQLANLR